MKNKSLESEKLYINRELSWIAFNHRVLQQAKRPDLPLLERLKFMAIVSSNLDEFFMIRVAGLMQQRAAGQRKKDPSGLTPAQQLEEINKQIRSMVKEQTAGIKDILLELKNHGISVLKKDQWSLEQKNFFLQNFKNDIMPILTPMALDKFDPIPLLPGRTLFVALLLEAGAQENNTANSEPSLIVIPVPSILPRFASISLETNRILTPIEEIIAVHASQIYKNRTILDTAYFRITRDADVEIQEDEAGDLLGTIEQAILERRRRAPVRLSLSGPCNSHIKQRLMKYLDVNEEDIYEIDGLLDATSLFEIASLPGYSDLKIPDWPPQKPRDLIDEQDLFQVLRNQDILLSHPYESFDPVIQLLDQAANDPDVLAIKQTLYRTSGDSPIIAALQRAAENGKQVTVLVELKARFDEAQNIQWARKLEDAGCQIIYGVANLKTHSKALIIVRREGSRIRRYVHLSTGNYNDKTARLYSDIGLMTSDSTLAADIASLFNLMTGDSDTIGLKKISIAPTGLRTKFYELIEREIHTSTPEQPGLIMAKLNSLEDKKICQALYKASQAGVEIKLNIRGICCLRPGMKGISETIEVSSIIDRFLEHARIFYFRNGGHPEIYLSSADWMGRNLDKRIETFFPITDTKLKQRLIQMLEIYFKDTANSSILQSDGTYISAKNKKKKFRAQKSLYEEAVKAAQAVNSAHSRFRPMRQPKK